MSGATSPAGTWSVYLLRRADGALYTGITTDVERRVTQHGDGRGAKSLRGRGPLRLVLARELGERGLATRVEERIKRLPKADKEALVARRELLDELVAELDEEPGDGGEPAGDGPETEG